MALPVPMIAALLAAVTGVHAPRRTPHPPPSIVSLTVQTNEGTTALGPEEAHSLARFVRAQFQCSFNSIETPEVFRHRDPEQMWNEGAAGPHIAARFDPPMEIPLARGNGTIRATEVLISRRPRHWLARDGDSILLFTKCSGTAMMLLECAPAIRPHFRPDERLCSAFEESVRPKPLRAR